MSRKDSASGYEQGTVVMLVSLAQLLVAGCAGAPPVDCGCVETIPGVTPTGCVKNNVRGVVKLILKGFALTRSAFRRCKKLVVNSRSPRRALRKRTRHATVGGKGNFAPRHFKSRPWH